MFVWMYWTKPVAIFFALVGLMLIVMTVLEIHRPTVPRKGFLPITTTRGDRLFIGLLGAAYINLIFIGIAGKLSLWFQLGQEPSIWWGTALSFIWLAVVMSKG